MGSIAWDKMGWDHIERDGMGQRIAWDGWKRKDGIGITNDRFKMVIKYYAVRAEVPTTGWVGRNWIG